MPKFPFFFSPEKSEIVCVFGVWKFLKIFFFCCFLRVLEHITNISPFLSYRYTSRLWLFLLLSLKPRPPTDTLMIKRKIQFFFSYERNSKKKEPRKLTTHKSTYIVRLLFLNQSRSTHRKAGHLEMVHRVDDIRLFPNWSI